MFEGKSKCSDPAVESPASPRRGSRTPALTRSKSKDSGGSNSPAARGGSSPAARGGSKSRGHSKSMVRLEQVQLEVSQVTAAMLEETMQEISESVKDWDTGGYTMVAQLQEAIRNHGRVDLMRTSEAEGRVRVAVKRMPTRWVRLTPEDFRDNCANASEKPWHDLGVMRELNKIGYPFVCKLLDVFRDQENTYVVTSLATRGDLFCWCDCDPKPGRAREEAMKPIVAQIATGVRWLHDLGIAHRDLSLENILLTEEKDKLQVKIIDFGMVTLSRRCRREVRGKQSYQAPEMHTDSEYDTYLSDAFALGVVTFAMAAQDYPWTSTKRNACQLYEYVSLFGFRKFLEKRRLRKGNGEHLIEVFSPPLVDALDGLLESEPQERVTLGELCYGKDRPSCWATNWLDGMDRSSDDALGRLAGG